MSRMECLSGIEMDCDGWPTTQVDSESAGCVFVISVIKADNGIGAAIDGSFQNDFVACVRKLWSPLVVNFNRHNYIEYSVQQVRDVFQGSVGSQTVIRQHANGLVLKRDRDT